VAQFDVVVEIDAASAAVAVPSPQLTVQLPRAAPYGSEIDPMKVNGFNGMTPVPKSGARILTLAVVGVVVPPPPLPPELGGFANAPAHTASAVASAAAASTAFHSFLIPSPPLPAAMCGRFMILKPDL
jgi:hypothetical protein